MSQMEYCRVLAEIQASPSQPNAPAKSAEVFSFTGSKRKKRSELALAVDHHSLGIYDVRSGNTVASYAVSPATAFTCPSASIKLSDSGSTEVRRNTYCSVLDPQPKLLRFLEGSKRGAQHGRPLETSTFNLPQNGSAVVHLEAVATHHTESEATTIDVLCVCEDGTVRCYDETLTVEKWSTRLASTHNDDHNMSELRVVHVSTISVEQARTNILKNREDVLSHFDAGQHTYTSNLLLFLTRSPEGSLTFRIWAIKNTGVTDSQTFLSACRSTEELASLILPEPMDVQGREASFRLHTSSGSLYQGTAGKLCIYDLTTVVPRLIRTANFPNSKGALSYSRVSSDIVAAIAPDKLFLIDTRFSSFQAAYALPMSKQARAKLPHGYKEKSPPFGTAGSQIVTYYSPSNSVIVLLGRSLMAVDLSASSELTASGAISRKRKRKGLLIDAIGRGSIAAEETRLSQKSLAHLPRAIGYILNPYQSPPEWDTQSRVLDALSAKDGVLAWDETMVLALEAAETSAGSDFAVTHPPNYKVDYIFSKIFSTIPVETKTQRQDGNFFCGLRVNFFPRRTWHYLVQEGLVTIERIEDSLRRQGRIEYNYGFRDVDLIQAFADYDRTLDSLSSILRSPCLLKVSEICHTLKIGIARTQIHQASDSVKLLTQGEDHELSSNSANRMELANGGSKVDSRQTSDQVDSSNALLDTIIERCNACSSMSVTKALRAQLSRTELHNVVDLLRVKLAQNGWLQLYTENEPPKGPYTHYNNQQLSSIGKLLNCAIESLGTGGWLLNSKVADDSTEGTLEIISYMRNEISAAVAGVEEATYLQGILGEVLLCGKTALSSQINRPFPAIDWTGQKAALPLGLKLDQNISLTKIGAGGELQKRSRRDIGKLKSRKVPEYSFERIAV
ncbi:MAG: hypothetical protein Q9184_000599 [Pyrenodesmia sp. 2 TL-2023]